MPFAQRSQQSAATQSTSKSVNDSKYMAWLRLIRWPNLLIVALTQFAAWWCVIRPLHGSLVLMPGNFLLLCLSTVLVAAGGYIINDYFDIRIDAINKPEKVILERDIPRRLAIIVHSIVNVLALLLAALVAVPADHPEWLLLQLICVVMLWRYSTSWKRHFMIGNVVVSLMTALTIIVLAVYEPAIRLYFSRPAFLIPQTGTGHYIRFSNGIPNPVIELCLFALFAFLLTWMREIVKDMEDYKGDDAEGCITMPIRLGLLYSTRFVQSLGLVTIGLLAFACIQLWRMLAIIGKPDAPISISALFIAALLILPLTLWLIQLPRAATVAHYHRASSRIKWIMVSGVVSLLVLYLTDYG